MSHDLRNALGYREVPASDPIEQGLRQQVFRARGRLVEAPTDVSRADDVKHAEEALASYLWSRACSQVAEDRKRHPKARRNAAVGSANVGATEQAPGRMLP